MDSTTDHAVGPESITAVGDLRKLTPAHLKELEASAITEETARAAGLHSEHDRRRIARLLNWKSWPQKYGACLVFPYLDLDGNTILHRVKPERPPSRKGRTQKYLQPKGVRTRAYLPPGVAKRLAGPDVEVLITEGEKKALCATQHGMPCIGMSGVWNWKAGGKVSELLPELEQIEWGGCRVFLAFDSDATENKQVHLAEQHLAAALQSRGATVKVIRIPASADGGKQGLDDFIVAEGAAAFDLLKQEAGDPDPIDPGLMKLSAKEMDPAEAAEDFAKQLEVDGYCRLKFWRGEWWYWERGGFRQLPVDDLRAKLVEFLSRDYSMLKRENVSNVLMHLESVTLVASHIDAPRWLEDASLMPRAIECVATKSGIIHLPALAGGADTLIPATPKFFTTSALSYAYDPSATIAAQWTKFLCSLWPDDLSSILLLQEWFGYCLTQDTRMQKALMVIGPKRSGKGTIGRVATELIGRANVAGPTLSSLASNFGLWPLLGKSLAIISDARLSGRADQAVIVERLLSITGEDTLSIDRKNLPFVTCKLPTRFMVLTNELPRLGDASGAMASRLLILHTPNSFYGQEDHGLTDRLMAELPAIFLWAVEGWQRLQEQGRFTAPESSTELTSQMADLSSPISAFVRDCCVVGPKHEVEVDELFKAWKWWCDAANQRPGDKARFGRDLAACTPNIRKERPRVDGDRVHVYAGIGVKPGHSGHGDQLEGAL